MGGPQTRASGCRNLKAKHKYSHLHWMEECEGMCEWFNVSLETPGSERCSCWNLHCQEQEKRQHRVRGRSLSHGCTVGRSPWSSQRWSRNPGKDCPMALHWKGLKFQIYHCGKKSWEVPGLWGEGRRLNESKRNLGEKGSTAGVFGEEWNWLTFCGAHDVANSAREIETFGCISHSFRAPVNCLSADNQWGTICQLRAANSPALTHSSQVLKCPVPPVRMEVPDPAAAQGLSSTFALI